LSGPGAPRVYLSGAIEHASDFGRGWRARLNAFLADDLGHFVYDPAADEKKSLTEEERSNFRRWKVADPARFREVVRKIIAWDLDRIESETDYLIALWDRASAQGGGTAGGAESGTPIKLLLEPDARGPEVLRRLVTFLEVREFRSEEPDLEEIFIQAVRDAA